VVLTGPPLKPFPYELAVTVAAVPSRGVRPEGPGWHTRGAKDIGSRLTCLLYRYHCHIPRLGRPQRPNLGQSLLRGTLEAIEQWALHYYMKIDMPDAVAAHSCVALLDKLLEGGPLGIDPRGRRCGVGSRHVVEWKHAKRRHILCHLWGLV
jgi:hypothetical protein